MAQKAKRSPQDAQSKDEFAALLDALTDGILWGRMYLWVWRHLNNALVEKPEIAKIAPVFFQLSLHAFKEEAFLYLSRLFDRKPGTVNLRMVLSDAEKNAGRFQKATAAEVRQLIAEQRQIVDQMASDVRPVLDQRHKLLAHRDLLTVADFEAIAKQSQITIGKMESLYDKAGQVVNEISGRYRGSGTLMELIGWDDFRKALRLMERGEQAELEDIQKKYH